MWGAWSMWAVIVRSTGVATGGRNCAGGGYDRRRRGADDPDDLALHGGLDRVGEQAEEDVLQVGVVP